MTQKIYEDDSYLYEFTATVVSCREVSSGLFDIELDRTAFFPEGGGQYADKGTINGLDVITVSEKDDVILHRVCEPIPAGTAVSGIVDREMRFLRMQNHTGEHLVSGIIHSEFGYNNVGFNFDDKKVTLIVDGPLTDEQITDIENKANEAVFRNAAVTAYYPDAETLASLDYRSKLENIQNVRIVNIEGYDTCACCAPHLKGTAEIGLIKIIGRASDRGGTRLLIVCGRLALEDYQNKHKAVRDIMAALAVKEEETAAAVKKMSADLLEERKKNADLLCRMAAMQLRTPERSAGGILYAFTEGAGCNELITCLNDMTVEPGETYLLLSGNDKNGYFFVMSNKEGSLRQDWDKISSAVKINGGGDDHFRQGKCRSTKEEILSALNKTD